MIRFLVAFISAGVLTGSAARADWPMARGDAARSGYSAAASPLKSNLALRWVRRAAQAPRPAWPGSKRVADDRAHHVVAAAGKLFFGSSVDCHIYALSADTGEELWSFAADAPITHYRVERDGREIAQVPHQPQVTKAPFTFDTPFEAGNHGYVITTVDARGRVAKSDVLQVV